MRQQVYRNHIFYYRWRNTQSIISTLKLWPEALRISDADVEDVDVEMWTYALTDQFELDAPTERR